MNITYGERNYTHSGTNKKLVEMKFPKQFLTVVLNESLSSAYPVADVWKTTLFLRQTGVMNRGLSFQEFKIP